MAASLVGVISDTHGILPATACRAFKGVDRIVHAGDVGTMAIVDELAVIAPVVAVRGNMDFGDAMQLPLLANFVVSGVRFLVGHRLGLLVAAVDPVRAGARVVVHGHTHHAEVSERDGILYVNPGSATRPPDEEFPTVALITLDGGHASARIVKL